jgi:glycosyltransferase involved in cell wall biosynthesis
MLEHKPLFSVVIPTYNSHKFLTKAIASVLSQTEQNFEILVVDNASKDGTINYLKNIQDRRIRVFEVNNFGIIAISRNIGIKNARGNWICFLDADDIWHKNKLEVCRNFMNKEIDVIYHDLEKYGEKKLFARKVLGSRALRRPALCDLLLNGNAINNSASVVRKSILEQVNYLDESPEVAAAEDYNLWLKIAQKSENFFFIKKILGKYYIGENSFSNKDMSLCTISASSAFTNSLNDKQLIKYDALMAYTSGRFRYMNKDYSTGVIYLLKSLKKGSLRLQIRSLYMLCTIYLMKAKEFLF